MDTLVVVLIGLLVVALGIYMVVSGNPSLLHSYHYATTPPAELPALARETGAGLIACGVGCMLLGVPALPAMLEVILLVVGILLLIGGIAFMLASIIRHNGGLITFAGTQTATGTARRPASWMPLAACTLAGVIIALTCIAPGAYMAASGDVSALHGYHYANVAPEDLPALAAGEGLSMIGLGVGIFICLLAGGLMATPGRLGAVRTGGKRRVHPALVALMLAGALVTAASLAAMLLVIARYNGSLMG